MPRQRCPYLLDWLMQAGLWQPGGAGPAALHATELAAWAALAGIELQPWEAGVLQRASRAYVTELGASADWPPYGNPDALYDDDTLAGKLAAGLDKLCS